ncbi:phosphatidylinositol polyphosphate 5-phosphatase type IV-like [Dendrobates tinctorius]|uniref:phosphatidylinositol polyphosphate 5-phosphatase type IV-like n=1 Tax=Dendrobates tinctorius TaxID=92724 RepID=UPI003CC99F1A
MLANDEKMAQDIRARSAISSGGGRSLLRVTQNEIADTNPYRSNPLDVTSRFDEVFWFGDFNFRLNKDRSGVNSILQRKPELDMSRLLQYDQLIKEMNEGSGGVQESE